MKFPVAIAGSSTNTKTGSWKAFYPLVDPQKCIKCGICHNFCPEGIMGDPKKVPEIDYDYCKGCSMCQIECPAKAITMERDTGLLIIK